MMRVLDSSRKAGASSEGPPCSEVSRFWRSSSVITPKSTSTAPDAFDHLETILDVRGDPVLQGTARRREGDADGDARTLYLDAPDHVQRDEVAPDLRVPHIPQSLTNTSLGEPVSRLRLPWRTVHQFFGRLARLEPPSAPFDASSLPVRLRNQSTTSANLLRHYRPAIPTSLKERKTPCFGPMLTQGQRTSAGLAQPQNP